MAGLPIELLTKAQEMSEAMRLKDGIKRRVRGELGKIGKEMGLEDWQVVRLVDAVRQS